MGQDLFPGSSLEQLDAVTDLLLHYDWYVRRRTPLDELVSPAKAPPDADSDTGN